MNKENVGNTKRIRILSVLITINSFTGNKIYRDCQVYFITDE